MWISRSTETKRRHTFRRPNDWTLVPVGWEGRDAVGEWSGAADIPPPWWDSLGRSGNRLPQFSTGTCCCTNKLTPGLCSNGIQTWCSKTKILFWVFFFFLPSFLPSSLSYFSSSSFTRLTHTPAEGCTSIIPNRPENIPCSFSLLQCSHTTALFDDVPVSPPHQRWPPWLSRAARPHWSPLISADALSHHFHMLSPVAPPPPSSLTCYFLHTVAAPEFRADSRIVRDLCLKRKKLKNHVRIHQKMLMNVNQVGGSLDSSLFHQGIYLEVLMLLLMWLKDIQSQIQYHI